MNEQFDTYIDKHDGFRELLLEIRNLILEFPFEETIKWGMPTYVYGGRNLLAIGAFKNHVGLWFFQGALLKDPKGILSNAQEGKTKAMRQLKFTSREEIRKEELTPLIEETLHNQDQGLFIKSDKKSSKIVLPPELKEAFKSDKELEACFEALTPGKKREYAEHLGSAKREATRQSRLDKATILIKAGKGLNDKYKKC